MKRSRKRASALLLALVMALSLLPTAALATEGTTNLALEKTVYVSGLSSVETATHTGDEAVDGQVENTSRWKSNHIKNGGTLNASNHHAWLVVDLGENVESISEIKLHFHFKTRATDYVLQVATNAYTPTDYSDNVGEADVTGAAFTGKNAKDDATYWTTIATVTNRAWQTGDSIPCDTFTAADWGDAMPESVRYIRFYATAMGTEAGENGVSIDEFVVNGVRAAQPDPEPIEGADNLALNRPVTASSENPNQNQTLGMKEQAVDGATTDSHWSSQDMKTGGASADPNAAQTPQWLRVDLGATGSRIDRIKLWYNAKVWPMVYEIQTTDTPDAAASWETVVRVARDPAGESPPENPNGWVMNAAGQNIADTATNTDTITTTSAPALQMTTLKRYVRFYCEKVNTLAPGNNVCLREIEINGVNENLRQPVDVAAVLASATNATVSAAGSAVTLPAAPEGATLAVAGSTLENVVANNGAIGGKNIGPREVKLLVRAWDNEAPDDYQQKNLTVTVPDHKSAYPSAWFPTVTSPNPKPEVIPAIQEWYGYNGSFTLTEESRIVIHDGGHVGLQKAAENMKADLAEITGLDLSIVTAASGNAHDIYIESLAADDYDVGSEGYLMRVSGDGVQIYAPTYTGCLFGAITVEQILWQAADHASVPMGIMRDYPAYAVRGLKLDVGRAPYRYQQLKDYAKIMLWYKMSEYDLHINDNENANASNGLATDQTHIGFHRLESTTYPSLAKMPGVKLAGVNADLVDADYYNDPNGFGGNPVYTKQQWKDLTRLTEDYGMHLLTEIDLPGHSIAYNQYVEKYPQEAAAAGIDGPIRSLAGDYRKIELLDLTGANKDRALRFAKQLWNEYTGDGTISGNVVHIGADEYWVHDTATNNAFAAFADELRKVIQGNLGDDTKIRMWGATGSSFATATNVLNMTPAQLAEHYQLEIWATNYDDPVARSKEGYQLVNCEQSAMYSCPGRHQRDVPNAEYLFNSWDPTMFGSNGAVRLLYGDPNLLGAKAVVWGEQTQEGLTERDVHQRVLRAIAITSEKTWGGLNTSEGTFSDYELRFNRLAEGPGTAIAMNIPSQSALVLAYDFTDNNISSDHKTVYDLSGNGYNATVEGEISLPGDGIQLDGSAVLKTPLKTLSYPYTVSLGVEAVDSHNDQNASLFSGYDGRIQVAGHNGHMSANNSSFIRDLNYTLPTDGTAVKVTIVGTQQAVRLYVNGELKAFLSQTGNTLADGTAPGAITSYFSSVPLPLEEIGKGFQGRLSDLRVYNKALSADEVAALYAGTDDGLVNVAQNAVAGGSSFHTGDGYDGQGNAHQRTAVAQKAVDGEEEEMYSFWRADHADSTLTVDLGESHPVSRIEAKWRGTAPGFTLQTSADGKAWTAFSQGASEDVEARFVKLTTRGAGDLAELLVYEKVDKTALADKLIEAERLLDNNAGFDQISSGLAYPPVALARAVKENPLATNDEVYEALKALQTAIDNLTLSDDAALSALVLSAGTLTPAFDPDVINYTASVPNSVTELTVTPTTRGPKAHYLVFINGSNRPADGGQHGDRPYTASLKEGENDIQVWVTAEDGETKWTYTVTLTRAASGSGGSSGGNGGGSIGGGGGSGTSAPAETTKTETREDGSKVTTVTDSKTGTVTETVTTPEGGKTETVTTKAGDVTITVTDQDGEELIKAEIPAEIPEPETKFEDVAETAPWAEEAILKMVGLELVKGTGDNKYSPVAPMTRGSLATVLHRLSQGKTDYANTFKDVAQGKYYTEGVAWAAKANVVKGISEDIFAPEKTITREQLAVMLARYAKLVGLNTKADGKALEQFADGDKTGSWAVDGMAWCVENGILKGKSGNALDPNADVTRAEVAVMLDRFISLLK